MGRTGGNSVDTKSSGSSTSTTQNMTAEQRAQYNKLLALYAPEIGKNENVWQGDSVAPFSTLQDTALGKVGGYADLFSAPTEDAANPLMNETGTALADILSGKTGAKAMTTQDTADYFKGAIYDPTMKSLREDVNPATQEAFSGPGFYGSARSQALQKNAVDTADTLNTNRANLNWNVLQNNQAIDEAKAGRAQTAVNQGMSYSQLPAQQTLDNLKIAASKLGGLGDVFGFGQQQQTQEQAVLQSEIAKFAEDNQITDPTNLAIILQLLGMPVSVTTSQAGMSKSSQNAYENSWKPGDWGTFAAQTGAMMMA
jgi:hypothetical protein